jgi:hypothetical protein
MWSLGHLEEGSVFRVGAWEFRVYGVRFGVWGWGCREEDLGFWVRGSGYDGQGGSWARASINSIHKLVCLFICVCLHLFSYIYLYIWRVLKSAIVGVEAQPKWAGVGIDKKRELISNLSGNEVSHNVLVIFKNACSKLHCQTGLNLILLCYHIWGKPKFSCASPGSTDILKFKCQVCVTHPSPLGR